MSVSLNEKIRLHNAKRAQRRWAREHARQRSAAWEAFWQDDLAVAVSLVCLIGGVVVLSVIGCNALTAWGM